MTNETEERAMSKPDAAALQERDQAIFTERMSGDALQLIAKRHGLSHERVRQITDKYGTQAVDDLELRLLENRRSNSDEIECYVIPSISGPDYHAALTVFQWLVKELGKRGVVTKTHYHPMPDGTGIVLGLEDVTPYDGGSK
jgi:hypothetical protein